jgi:hypothetical protein
VCVQYSIYSTAVNVVGEDSQKKRVVKAARKDMDPVYTKLCDVIGALAELVDHHSLPDATLLQVQHCMIEV